MFLVAAGKDGSVVGARSPAAHQAQTFINQYELKPLLDKDAEKGDIRFFLRVSIFRIGLNKTSIYLISTYSMWPRVSRVGTIQDISTTIVEGEFIYIGSILCLYWH